MQRTDVFVGMHSDMWTNALFLRDEAAAVQLVPYGWEHAPGSAKPLIRGNFYQAIVVCRTIAVLKLQINLQLAGLPQVF